MDIVIFVQFNYFFYVDVISSVSRGRNTKNIKVGFLLDCRFAVSSNDLI